MGMKTTLLAALAVSLFATTAFAQSSYRPQPPPGGYRPGVSVGVTYGNANYNNRYDDDDYDDDYYRRHNWRRGNRRGGHYELRNVQQWVQGQSQQVWVAGTCHRSPSGLVNFCTPGRYVTQASPGYYTTVQQWVWVEHQRPQRWGRR